VQNLPEKVKPCSAPLVKMKLSSIQVQLRHHDLKGDHRLSAQYHGVIIRYHTSVIGQTIFPLIALCHHAYTFYRDHSVIGQKFSDHDQVFLLTGCDHGDHSLITARSQPDHGVLFQLFKFFFSVITA